MATNIDAAFAKPGQNFEGDLARYSVMLHRTALRRVRNPADAKDAVQDGWLSVCKPIDQFEGRARFSTWLTTIVLNAAGSQLRRQSGSAGFSSLEFHPAEKEVAGLCSIELSHCRR